MNAAEIKDAKGILRREMLAERGAIPEIRKREWDDRICSRLLEIITQKSIKTVHTYIPFLSEIDIKPVIEFCLQNGIKVIAPKTLKARQLENRVLTSLSDLEIGIMGTLHPANAEVYSGKYDLIIVPGLAVDKQNYRLGYGGGYYDNFLVHRSDALRTGIYYPFQLFEEVPREQHDVALDQVIIPE
ncbi:MAG: hypothetical protein RL007_565 [Bacteroidota bacterium]|jgi:5-formyltetrahydrofolate cyclo-ligase